MRTFAFTALNVGTVLCRSAFKHNVANPTIPQPDGSVITSPFGTVYTEVNSIKSIWSSPWPDTPVEGPAVVAGMYVPILLGAMTALPPGVNICDVLTFWPMNASATASSGLIAFNTQMEMWHCSAHFDSATDIRFLDRYYDAGFQGITMYSSEGLIANMQNAGNPPLNLIYWNAKLPIMAVGTLERSVNNPPDALAAMIFMATTLVDPTVVNYIKMDPDLDHLMTPGVLAGLIILSIGNFALIILSLIIMCRMRCSSVPAALVVFFEGILASSLRIVSLSIYEPSPFRSVPLDKAFFDYPGVSLIASLVSSLILGGIFALVALGSRSSRLGVKAIVWLSVLGSAIAVTAVMLQNMRDTYIATGSPKIENGMIRLDLIGDLLATSIEAMDRVREWGQNACVAVVSVYFVLSLRVGYAVTMATAQASEASKRTAKHMLSFMIPNIVFLAGNTACIFLAGGSSAPLDQVWAIDGDYSYVLGFHFGGGVTSLLAGFTQVGVFFRSSSSSSSSSSSLSSSEPVL